MFSSALEELQPLAEQSWVCLLGKGLVPKYHILAPSDSQLRHRWGASAASPRVEPAPSPQRHRVLVGSILGALPRAVSVIPASSSLHGRRFTVYSHTPGG